MPVDTVAPPEFIEEPVTFVDFIFVGGERDQLTLRLKDTFEWTNVAGATAVRLQLHRGHPKPDSFEEVVYFQSQIVGIRTVEGIIKHPVKKPDPKNV